ncbi:MAG: phenylalanine--tRNA ligase subunit beta [Oscillospiraceae bacterium]|jgi:phenylalanyl-tRNA synthetase beta chain|nr:phenylalanine--tRNA ligase subunit beta [Oscillospiraceae bacterium]
MKLSREWLNEFVALDGVSDKEFADKMTMSGSIVEGTDNLSEKIKNIVIGRVTEIKRHEDSDHLWVCAVDIGKDEPVTIVTGAQNLKVGDVVPAALHNSFLPGGTKITKGKIRGVKSEGMLCGLEELELDTHDFPFAIMDGILTLNAEFDDAEFSIGDDANVILGFDDSVADFEITNNRPDCLCVRGLARESAVTFNKPLNLPEPKSVAGTDDVANWLTVEIAAPELCSRYSARVVKNVKIEPSPRWLRRRLRASGVRPINNIVDVTNYVMLEYGQPMHAFDYACIEGNKIIVRRANDGEVMNTLDGNPRKLNPDMLLITDPTKPIGLAGVMGGENSEITDDTKTIVLESATFNGTSVRKTALALGMRTDASSRFEKGLDIDNTVPAVERACELISQLGAGEIVGGISDVWGSKIEKSGQNLQLEPNKINALLGTNISTEFMLKTLADLGFSVNGEKVSAPSWRSDIEHWTDLSEEVARFWGYDVIEESELLGSPAERGLTVSQKFKSKVKELALSLGYSETMTYSLTDAVNAPDGPEVINPLGEDKSRMRTSMLPSMLEVVKRNIDYGNANGKLFEVARVYWKSEDSLPVEQEFLILAAYGAGVDFYGFKGGVEELLAKLRIGDITWEAEQNPSYHPGRQAKIKSGGNLAGVFGQVHPSIADGVYVAEININEAIRYQSAEPTYKPLPKYPAVLRDLALVCDKSVTVYALENAIRLSGGKLLESVEFFDLYEGPQVPEGKKSVAFSLQFRDAERSLTDEIADEAMSKIISGVKEALGAEIRK